MKKTVVINECVCIIYAYVHAYLHVCVCVPLNVYISVDKVTVFFFLLCT